MAIDLKPQKHSEAGTKSLLRHIVGVIIFLAIWQLLTLFFPPMVVPTIPQVLRRLVAIIKGKKFWGTLSVTICRFFLGVIIGITAGGCLGVLCGISKKAEDILAPFISIFQVVPPICWVVLALVWFGFNGKPCIFIVATASVPPMVLNLVKGIHSVDQDLLEMGRIYHFSRKKELIHIVLPSIRPFFLSALNIVIGSGWKLVVMGEVLTTSTGIGGAITTARLNIEPDAIIAWAVILVTLCFGTEWLIRRLLPGRSTQNA